MLRRLLLVTLAALALPARAQEACSALSETTFVRLTMKYIYFWNKEMADRDPALYDSAQEYLEAVRYRPLDD